MLSGLKSRCRRVFSFAGCRADYVIKLGVNLSKIFCCKELGIFVRNHELLGNMPFA